MSFQRSLVIWAYKHQPLFPSLHHLHRLQLLLLHLDRKRGLVLLTVRAFAPKIEYLYLFIYLSVVFMSLFLIIVNCQKFATISLFLEFLIFTKARFPVGPQHVRPD